MKWQSDPKCDHPPEYIANVTVELIFKGNGKFTDVNAKQCCLCGKIVNEIKKED